MPRFLTLLAVVVLAAGAARAGTRRHDVADSAYTSLAAHADYECVGSITASSAFASGVLVANNYVLTAGHVGETGGSMTFALSSGDYVRAWAVVHPDWTGETGGGNDLALVRLKTLVLDEPPAALYTATDEAGRTGTVVGFGDTGTGLTGATEPAGTKRAGQNVFELTGASFGYPDDLLFADFDNPSFLFDSWFGRRRPIGLEYLAAPGDSGGGMFLSDGGHQKLAGIVSFIASRDGAPDSDYGDAMGVVRIASHADWLTAELSVAYTMWWPGDSGAFNAGYNWRTTFDEGTVKAVPGALDAVRFAANGSRTVTWPAADLANTRLSVAAGNVTLDLAGQTYTLTDPGLSQPSLVVGETAGAGQALTVLNGTLSTRHAFLGQVAGSDARLTVGAGAVWNAGGSVFVGGTDSGSGGAATLAIAAGAQADIAGALTVWPDGTLEPAGGDIDVAQVQLAGGTLAGSGVFDVPVVGSNAFIDVAADETLTLVSLLQIGAESTLTKTGAGTLMVDGPQAHGTDALLDILAGIVWLNSDAGSGAGGVSISVTDAVLQVGSNQHLDTLEVGAGGTVVFADAYTVVVKRLVFGGLDLGPTTLLPEPATLGLLMLGAVLLVRRSRSLPV